MNKYTETTLGKKHPRIGDIVSATLSMALPAKRLGGTLMEVLKGCKVITVHAAAEATGHRYARSTISEYAMLARVASQGIGEYLDSLEGSSSPKAVRHGV